MFKMLNCNSVLFVILLVFLHCKSIGFPAKFHFIEVIGGIKIKGVFLFLFPVRPIPMSKRPIFFFTLSLVFKQRKSFIFSDPQFRFVKLGTTFFS